MKSHKVTFVHDWLYYIAGAEQVFFDLIHDQIRRDEASPHPKTNSGHPKTNSGHPNVDSNRPQNAINQSQIQYKIYTMFSNKHFLSLSADRHDINDIKIPIVTALPRRVFAVFVFFDQHKIPFLSKLLDYRNLMFFYPLLIRILRQKIKKYTPNEIHISSFAVAKNVADNCKLGTVNCKLTLHAQSPFMYIHNHYQSNLKKLKFPIKQLYQLAHWFLTPRDLKPRKYDIVTANSQYTAGLIQGIYSLKNIEIKYPKLNPVFFSFEVVPKKSDLPAGRQGYFVFIGRLVTFSKQVDIIINAFNQTGDALKIIGAGPDEQYLKSIAGANIEFLGRIQDPTQRCNIIGKAQGLVNITLESFGYVTAESICLGTPVIGYNKGASTEIINLPAGRQGEKGEMRNGVLIEKQDVGSLTQGIRDFKTMEWDYEGITKQARARFQSSDLRWRME